MPILPKAFCSAWSRTLHVLISTTSASASVAGHGVALLDEHLRHLLGVALVHLAAVGLDVNAGHGTREHTRTWANDNRSGWRDAGAEIEVAGISEAQRGDAIVGFGVQRFVVGGSHGANGAEIEDENAFVLGASGMKGCPALLIGKAAALGIGEAGPSAGDAGPCNRGACLIEYGDGGCGSRSLLALIGRQHNTGDGHMRIGGDGYCLRRGGSGLRMVFGDSGSEGIEGNNDGEPTPAEMWS